MRLWLPEGTGQWQDAVDDAPPLEAVEDPLKSSTKRLSDFSKEFCFYTPALIYAFSAFDKCIPIEFMEEIRKPVRCASWRFKNPVFRGIPKTEDPEDDWNHYLYGIEVAQWQAFYSYISQVTIVDRQAGSFSRLGFQRFLLVDPLFLDSVTVLPSTPPAIVVWTIGLDGMTAQTAFKSAAWLEPPMVVHLPPSEETIKLGQEVLKQAPTPFRVIEGEPGYPKVKEKK